MRKIFCFILVIASYLIFSFSASYAQCPSSITISSVSVTPATCPSNGSAVVNNNASANNEVLYRIISGPTGYQTTPQSSNTFNALKPGAYTVEAYCGSVTDTEDFTIANQYTAPTISSSVTACTDYTTGGAITVTGGGSSTPLQYGILQSTNAAADDALFTYQATNVFNTLTFGTYQLRVKDACNNYVTQTVILQPSIPPATISFLEIGIRSCDTWIVFANLKNSTGQNLTANAGDYKLELWESTTQICPVTTPPSTTPTISYPTTNTPSGALELPISSTTRSYFYRLTTKCGEIRTGCQNLTDPRNFIPIMFPGCPISTNDIRISGKYTLPINFNIIGYDAGNNQISNQTFNITFRDAVGITAAHHYTYTATDACGKVFTGNLIGPGSASASVYSYTPTNCTNVLGSGQVTINVNNIPGWTNMTPSDMKLVNSSSGAVYTPYLVGPSYISYLNVPPGNYVLKLTSGSGAGACVTEIPLTVSGNGLTYQLTADAVLQCGGGGTITANVSTNATNAAITYRLKNLAGNVISSNTTGSFVNVSAGTYTIEAVMPNSCGGAAYAASKQITISPDGSEPIVVRKLGVICDGSTSGFASFKMNGAAPYKLEMKLASDPNYTLVTTNMPNEYIKEGLSPNLVYDFRFTDNCGKTTTTQVSIESLTTIAKLTTMSPCVNQPYTLSVEQLPGASYAWTFNGGGVISSSPDLYFPSYSANNNGTYVCTVSYDGCTSRQVTYVVNSTYCGSPLPVAFGNIEAYIKSGILHVNWATLHELDNRMYEIELSRDGNNFKRIGTLQSKALNGDSSVKLDYNFKMPLSTATNLLGVGLLALLASIGVRNRRMKLFLLGLFVASLATGVSCNKEKDEVISQKGTAYYIRIVIVDNDGNKAYSKILKVTEE